MIQFRFMNKKQYSFLMFIVVLVLVSHVSHAGENSYNSRVLWKEGEKSNYKIIKTREKIENGKNKLKATTHTDLELEVLKAMKEGYLISWKLGETRFDDPVQANNPMVKATSNVFKDFKILLEIDKAGTIIDMPNWQDVQARSVQAASEMTTFLTKSSGLSDQQIQQMEQQLKSMYSSKEQIIMLTTREAQMFFFTQGKDYSLAEPIAYDDYLPNPFGGNPFPAKATLRLDSLSREKDLAKITWTQKLDQVETQKIMFATLSALASRLGKPAPNPQDVPPMEISDVAEFELSISSGWLNRLKHKRSTTSAGREQSDELQIIKQ